jgi:hypothetical protein
LVAAEVTRLEGRELDAERLYEEAIRLPRDNGFVHNERNLAIASRSEHGCSSSFQSSKGLMTTCNLPKHLPVAYDGRVQVSGIPRRGSEATLLLVVNAHHDVVVFKLPEVAGGRDWLRLVDTNLPDEDDELEDAVRFAFGDDYDVTARSLLLFLLRPERRRRQSRL